jgi:L-ascorbate metabolism protein UlaG (beta-lactamase superfamily)
MSDVAVTHIGGPTVLLEVDGWRILTDPTFDPPGRTYKFGWATSSTKTSGPALTVEDIGPVDVVLVTHDHHSDNLDDTGRAFLPSARTVVTTVAGARRLGGGARGLNPWNSTRIEADGRTALTVTATPCRHGPPLSRPIVGHVIGFALAWEGRDRGAVWFTGDTVLYDGVRSVAGRFDIEVAIVHLGDVQFPITGPVKYTMTAADGVELVRHVRPTVAIPVHYEGWSHFHEGRTAIERAIAAADYDVAHRFRLLTIGERTTIP